MNKKIKNPIIIIVNKIFQIGTCFVLILEETHPYEPTLTNPYSKTLKYSFHFRVQRNLKLRGSNSTLFILPRTRRKISWINVKDAIPIPNGNTKTVVLSVINHVIKFTPRSRISTTITPNTSQHIFVNS